MGSRNAAWFQSCAASTSTGNPNAAAPHQSQSAPSTSTGNLNVTAVLLPSAAVSTLTGNLNVPPALHHHHRPALSTSTGSLSAARALHPLDIIQLVALATPSQLALASSQSHRLPTPRFRQLHQQPCQPSQPRSSEPAWSPPSCKGSLSSRNGPNLLASPGSPLVWQSVYRNVAPSSLECVFRSSCKFISNEKQDSSSMFLCMS